MEEPNERPKWSVTWLFRIQRVGRNRPPDAPSHNTFGRIFPWAVVLLLMVFIAVGVWLDLIPR